MFLYLLTVTDINLFVDWLYICIYLVPPFLCLFVEIILCHLLQVDLEI
jgi:hypothetical protein